MSILSSLSRLFPFALLIGATFWIQMNPIHLKTLPDGLLDYLPFILAGLGGSFAWYFRRGNIAITLGLIASAYFILENFSSSISIVAGLSVLLPLNVWLLAVWIERGVVTSSGLGKIFFIALQFLALFLIAFGQDGQYAKDLLRLIAYQPDFLSLPFTSALPFTSLSLFCTCGMWFFIQVLRNPLPLNMGWLSLIVTVGASFWFPQYGSLFLSCGLLCLSLAVILDSYRMAFLDELTGLPGRRALMSDMKKLGNRYVIAMADIDHFKKFNDTYGHDVGDQVLCMVATNLSKVTGGGFAYRYGGEEFTIVFPNRTMDHAMEHLEKVRLRVEEASFTLRSKDRPKKKPRKGKTSRSSGTQKVQVTSSFGVAEKTKNASTPMAVMKEADKALYRAKKAGRNQVLS